MSKHDADRYGFSVGDSINIEAFFEAINQTLFVAGKIVEIHQSVVFEKKIVTRKTRLVIEDRKERRNDGI